jgi:hypothetical protein
MQSRPAVVQLEPVVVYCAVIEAAIHGRNLEQAGRARSGRKGDTSDALDDGRVSGTKAPYHESRRRDLHARAPKHEPRGSPV